jgi:DNA polymerase I-like protein with 3'-5' exonuclease and polymerase domains
VHYASKLKCDEVDTLVQEFIEDPNLDMHQRGADMLGIGRKECKAVTLGYIYGIGIAKLADQLGISLNEAKEIKDKFNCMLPFVSQLNDICQSKAKQRGYIKTLGGRISRKDPDMFIQVEGTQKHKKVNFLYKTLNKLLQGSAADQTIKCMIEAYKQGIPVLFPVHDSLEVEGGLSWAEAKQK